MRSSKSICRLNALFIFWHNILQDKIKIKNGNDHPEPKTTRIKQQHVHTDMYKSQNFAWWTHIVFSIHIRNIIALKLMRCKYKLVWTTAAATATTTTTTKRSCLRTPPIFQWQAIKWTLTNPMPFLCLTVKCFSSFFFPHFLFIRPILMYSCEIKSESTLNWCYCWY